MSRHVPFARCTARSRSRLPDCNGVICIERAMPQGEIRSRLDATAKVSNHKVLKYTDTGHPRRGDQRLQAHMGDQSSEGRSKHKGHQRGHQKRRSSDRVPGPFAPSLAGALRQPPRSAPVAAPSYSVVLPPGTDVAVRFAWRAYPCEFKGCGVTSKNRVCTQTKFLSAMAWRGALKASKNQR
jgi:hypothetical protein